MGHNETVSRINQKRENKNKIDTQLPFHSSSTYRATFHIPTGLGGSFRDRRRRMVIRGLRGQLDRNRLAEALQERPRVRGHHRNNDAILNPHFINVRPTLITTTAKKNAGEEEPGRTETCKVSVAKPVQRTPGPNTISPVQVIECAPRLELWTTPLPTVLTFSMPPPL